MSSTPDNPAPTVNKPIVLWGALILSGVSWGVTGPLSKIAVSTGHHPVGITFWATVIGCVILTLVLIARRERLPLSRRHIVFYLVCGFLGTAFPHSISFTAYKFVSVGVVVIILSLVPMLTFFVAFLAKAEKPDFRRFLGLVLGIVAVLLIMLPESSLPEASHWGWIILLIIMSLSYSIETVYIKLYKPEDCSAFTVICGLTWGALLLLIPAVVATNGLFDISNFEAPENALIAQAFLHVVSYFTFIWLVSAAGPVFASQVGYLVTGVGVLLGILIFGETHSIWVWAALVLMMVGLTLVKPREE